MSFHLSAKDIFIENGHILTARLFNEEGSLVDSQIDLNEFLGNNNGHFEWHGENFSESAENVRFSIEDRGQVPALHALLRDDEGNWREADVNLSDHIENRNGQFVFSESYWGLA